MNQFTLLLERLPRQKQFDFHNISIEVDKDLFQLLGVFDNLKIAKM